ncbi:MAG: hypothetical protein AB1750_04105 [Chloroflexota bacterium]
MATYNALKNVRFVRDAKTKEPVVQMKVKVWKALLEYLEDVEDRPVIKAFLKKLVNGPQKVGALDWNEIEGQW